MAYSYHSPLGWLTIVSDGQSIVGLWMESQTNKPAGITALGDADQAIEQARKWLDDYFACKAPSISDLPLKPQGTPFQQAVWERLCRIPYGQTVTYGQIAAKLALQRGIDRMSAQAVGQAVGANPIGIMIPCHRVMGAGGKLTGYAYGIDKKLWLLRQEGICL